MPRLDLRKDRHRLDALAPFKVLATMCHPNDLGGRERMMALLHSETGHGKKRRRPLTTEAYLRDVRLHSTRAGVAGMLLLTMIQLNANGHVCSLTRTIPVVAGLLPEWEQPTAPTWTKEAHVGHCPCSRRKMLEAYRVYRPVAHLWAAMIHGLQHKRDDIFPGSIQTVPVFLSYSNSFLAMACTLPSPARNRRFVLTTSEAWTFTVPERFLSAISLEALALDDSQQRILNERKAHNKLI